MAEYITAKLADLTRPIDPANPGLGQVGILPITITEGVINLETGEDLAMFLGRMLNSYLFGHITNNALHVTQDWTDNVNGLLAYLLAFTRQDFITEDERTRWDEATANALEALALARDNAGNIANIFGRLLQVEDSLFNDIYTNLFTANFTTLDGVLVVRGIWNRVHNRIEC